MGVSLLNVCSGMPHGVGKLLQYPFAESVRVVQTVVAQQVGDRETDRRWFGARRTPERRSTVELMSWLHPAKLVSFSKDLP